MLLHLSFFVCRVDSMTFSQKRNFSIFMFLTINFNFLNENI